MHYHEFIETIMNSNVADWLYDDEFRRYVFIGNVSISILTDREFYQDFVENWTNNFSDNLAYANRFHLTFNGSIVETFYATAVDGYKMLIPYPKIEGMTISQKQYEMGRIINIPYTSIMDQYDEYLRIAGITIRDEE